MPQGKSHRKPGLYFFGLVRTWDAACARICAIARQQKAPHSAGLAGLFLSRRQSPAAARSASALSVRSQVKAVKVSSPTVIS